MVRPYLEPFGPLTEREANRLAYMELTKEQRWDDEFLWAWLESYPTIKKDLEDAPPIELSKRRPKKDYEQHELYRYFDSNGVLLYVGISFSAIVRASQHRTTSAWWSEFTTMTVERFPSRAELEEAERRAIGQEKPKHNVRDNDRSQLGASQ